MFIVLRSSNIKVFGHAKQSYLFADVHFWRGTQLAELPLLAQASAKQSQATGVEQDLRTFVRFCNGKYSKINFSINDIV
jgi:hypothetical protein